MKKTWIALLLALCMLTTIGAASACCADACCTGTSGMDETQTMEETCPCMMDGKGVDGCPCVSDMCGEDCLCMDGKSCMKDGACMDGCMCGKDGMTDKDMADKDMMEEDTSMKFPSFEGMDLDGNPVTSELFKENSVTVVNFWFSGCAPCIGELGELNTLNETLKLRGGAVIGVNTDTLGGDKRMINEAKKLLEKKGAAYQNIYFPSDSAAGDFAGDIMAFPTTYVIDRSGAIVGEAMLGGIDNEDNMAALQKLIDQALANDSAK